MKKFMSIFMTVAMLFAMCSVALASSNFSGVAIGTFSPTSDVQDQVGKTLAMIQWIGYAIAVGMLIYIGIKYIMASANEKADLKSSLVKYVIGAVLIAAASAIAGAIFNGLA